MQIILYSCILFQPLLARQPAMCINKTLVALQDTKGPTNEDLNLYSDCLENGRQPNLNFPTNVATITCTALCILFVLVVNLCVLLWVKMKDRVLVDTMVTLDCITNLLVILVVMMAFPVRVYSNNFLCAGISFFRCMTVTMKRLEKNIIIC